MTYLFSEKLFALPLSHFTPYISARLRQETDFLNEAANAERMRGFVDSEPTLRDRVHIPKVYHDLSTRRVMIAEWIDGISISERALLTAAYRNDAWVGHTHGTPITAVLSSGPRKRIRDIQPLPPHSRFYGLGLRERDIMKTMVDLFCAQMFLFGWLHCDPHPGNILVRRRADGRAQLVLLDHGLYISTTRDFRRQYAEFWKALLTLDNGAIARVAAEWGIGNADLFASATLLRPYTGGSGDTARIISGDRGKDGGDEGRRSAYEAHVLMREKMGEFLTDQDKMPKELLFIGRNMRIVQSNNQSVSPLPLLSLSLFPKQLTRQTGSSAPPSTGSRSSPTGPRSRWCASRRRRAATAS